MSIRLKATRPFVSASHDRAAAGRRPAQADAQLASPIFVKPANMGSSVGVALFPADGDDPEALLHNVVAGARVACLTAYLGEHEQA